VLKSGALKLSKALHLVGNRTFFLRTLDANGK
jgi:hypothetical protein